MVMQIITLFFGIFLILLRLTTGHFMFGKECATPYESIKWGPYLQQLTVPFEHGEEPTWDHRTQLLYFVDLHKGLVNSYNPKTDELNQVQISGTASPIIPTNTLNKFAVGNNNTLAIFYWNGKNNSGAENFNVLASVENDKPGNRFNDGKADKYGRLWWGTIGYENASGVIPDQASLYKFKKESARNPNVEIRPVTNSNGLAWSRDNTKFFYIDTPTRKIAMYDFDVDLGTISNKTIVFDLAANNINGLPDGMTIDEEDNLFIALYGGGAIIKINPYTGAHLQTISIPAQDVTSCTFGGKDLDILFVTTSRVALSENEKNSHPAAGSVFALTNLGTKGVKAYFADF